MQKNLLMIVITLVLISGGLSGCNEADTVTTDNFVGTWKISGVNYTEIYTFSSDGSYLMTNPGTNESLQGTWELKEGKFIMRVEWEEHFADYIFDYSFSNNNTILTLTEVSTGLKRDFIRQ